MCPGFPLVSVGDFFPYLFSKPIAMMTEISRSSNNTWLHPVGVLKVLYYLYLQLSSLQMKVLSAFQKLLMMCRIEPLKTAVFGLWQCKAEQRFFFSFFFILTVYLQNRFQQLKCIYGLMEKASVGGFLALKEWEPHQWQRKESVDYSHKAGQGAQGKQKRLIGVFAECSSEEPGSASALPGSWGQTQCFSFVQEYMLNTCRESKWL